MTLTFGLAIVLFAAILQGTFILPMNHTRDWKWEHSWFMFSALGMVVLNAVIGFATIPSLLGIYSATPRATLLLLGALGFGWGIGAVLFGLGMARLGMALGYPIIMGLIAVLGGLLPFLLWHARDIVSPRGAIYFLGTALAIIGILFCSRAADLRDQQQPSSNSGRNSGLLTGLLIAIFAGVLSCLPNLGISLTAALIQAGASFGVPPSRAANAVWVLFFGMGFLANGVYCLWKMGKGRNLSALPRNATSRNLGLIFSMAAMWIGSFYLYGIGTSFLGPAGVIFAWPLFICTSIVVGNFWGIRAGEWNSAPPQARVRLRIGLAILIASVIVISLVNLARPL
jgi:L-rhamnose-H+ transport protein